jgi:hypothetical protein
MRRRTLLVALAGLAVVVAAGAIVLLRRDRVTRQNFDRITVGMSRTEVESILGPPGDSTSGPVRYDPTGLGEVIFQIDSPAHDRWMGDHGSIDIWFPEYESYSGARHMTFDNVERIAQSPLDNLLWRVKRRWPRWFPDKPPPPPPFAPKSTQLPSPDVLGDSAKPSPTEETRPVAPLVPGVGHAEANAVTIRRPITPGEPWRPAG